MISLEEFRRLDLRVGRIFSAEPVPGTDFLLRVEVDLGEEKRTLVAGLAAHYAPQDLVGLSVIVVANMEPATIRNVVSEGMLLGAGCSDGRDVALLTVNKEVPSGTRVE